MRALKAAAADGNVDETSRNEARSPKSVADY